MSGLSKRLLMLVLISVIVLPLSGLGSAHLGMLYGASAQGAGLDGEDSRSIYLDDFDEMWKLLEECYPYFNAIERKGINVSDIKEQSRIDLENNLENNEGFEGFFKSAHQVCASLGYFAHLRPVDRSHYQYLSNLVIHEEDRRAFEDWFSVLNQPRSAELYKAPAGERTEEAAFVSSSLPMDPFVRLYPDEGVGYIRLRSFDGSIAQRDQQKIERFLQDTRDYGHIIIDITGNPGGSTYYWHNITEPLGGRYSYEYYAFYTAAAAEKMPLSVPRAQLRSMEDLPEDVAFLHPEDKEKLGYYTELSHRYDWGSPRIPHKARRWLLVDQQVYSAAEELAVFCKETGWAVLVGHSTMGDGMGSGMPGIAALPNTGLILQFSSDYCLNSDGSCNAESGTSPDILCQSGETPIMACLRQLETEGVNTQRLRRDRTLVWP